MENNKGNKAKNILQKLYYFRMKVDKQGKPIVNVSTIFGLVCLVFAPKLTAISVIASLILGYQYKFESEDMDDAELEERIKKAASNVKNGATSAVRSIQEEINKTKSQRERPAVPAEPARTAEPAAQPESAQPAEPTNEELLRELQTRAAEMTESNPAATTFHSAYAASAGKVPVLQVSEEEGGTPEPRDAEARSNKE